MAKNKPITLSIIIVSYNTADLTMQTIQSVEQSLKNDTDLLTDTELIVVDNNSSDDSITRIESHAKHSSLSIQVIANKDNRGFAWANNQGIEHANGELILLLNSDTIVHDNALSELVSTMQNTPIDETTLDLSSYGQKIDRLGVLAAKLLNPDGTPQHQGGSFPSLSNLFFHMTFLDDVPVFGKLLPSTQHTGLRADSQKLSNETKLTVKDWVAGTALLTRKNVIEEIGPLDQNIFMYGEDIEFCIRAQHHHWDVAEHQTAVITHYGTASSSSKNAIQGELKGYLYIWAKHKPDWQYPLALAILKLGCQLRRFVFGTILRDTSRAQIYRQALLEMRKK